MDRHVEMENLQITNYHVDRHRESPLSSDIDLLSIAGLSAKYLHFVAIFSFVA
jgi:hypothetical protein